MASTAEAPSATLVSNWGFCPSCDAISFASRMCSRCLDEASRVWGDPNGIGQKRAQARGRARFAEHQRQLAVRRRRKLLEKALDPKHCGARQRRLRTIVIDKFSQSYTITLGCAETHLGCSEQNVAGVVTSMEGRWYDRASQLPARRREDCRRRPGRVPWQTGARVWSPVGISEEQWQDRRLPNATYGLKQLGACGEVRALGALKWALENAYEGVRNERGRWLAWRSTDAGLDEDQTWKVMESYWAEVNLLPASQMYGWTEVRATVRHARSVYRQCTCR